MKRKLIYLFNLVLWSVYSFAQDTLGTGATDPGGKGTIADPGGKGTISDPGGKGTNIDPGSENGAGGGSSDNWMLYLGIALVIIIIIYFVMKSRKKE